MTYPANPQKPESEATQTAEFTGGNRGTLSGRNDEQNRAVGQDDPLAEGSRQGRERHKTSPDKDLPGDAEKAV